MKAMVRVCMCALVWFLAGCTWQFDLHFGSGCDGEAAETSVEPDATSDPVAAFFGWVPVFPTTMLDGGAEAAAVREAGMDAPYSYPDGGRRYASLPTDDASMDARSDGSAYLLMDARSTTDARADASGDTASRDVAIPDAGPLDAIVLSPLTCSDRGVRLPTDFFRPGREVWHFCFVTPTLRQADGVGFRPVSVVFARRDERGGFTQDLVYFPAPRTADPWTASVAVSLPLAASANLVLNIRLENGEQVAWAADRPDGGTRVMGRGSLRAWTVARDGAQTLVETRLIRSHCLRTNPDTWFPAGGYLPRSRPCPPETLSCQDDPTVCTL